MGKIDELIKELCPDGVEYVKLGEIATLSRGKVYSKEYVTENAGVYPLYSSQTRNDGIFGLISSFDYEGEYLTWTTDGAYAGSIFHRKGKFSITNVCGLITIKNKCISYRFLYYWLSIHAKEYVYEGMGNPKLMTNQMIGIQIPLPPLSIQQQIMEILDNFTDSISNLQEELELREKQMEYYRESLLLFDNENAEWKSIKELFETRNGYTPSTKNSSFWTDGDIPWFKMEDIRDNGHILKDSYSHINKTAIKGKGLFKANSIIIATSATIGEHALIKTEHLSNQRFTNLYPNKEWINKINMKFIYYYMYIIDEWCKTHVKQGGFASVDMDGFYKQEIPAPSLSRQQEIVDILDTFESMIANIKEEIELRQKQYEYYREKLLTFD